MSFGWLGCLYELPPSVEYGSMADNVVVVVVVVVVVLSSMLEFVFFERDQGFCFQCSIDVVVEMIGL